MKLKILKPFDKDIKFSKLFLYWLFFLCIGIFLMLLITPLHPSFSESQNEINENFCQPINLIFVCFAFLTETILLMLLPWKIFGKRGLVVGLIIWSLLHLIGGNLPIFIYILVMAFFYFRCLEIGKWKFVLLAHFLINLPALATCLFK